MIKIFSYGFTTKKDGHGFGMHSSYLMAKEMQGNLQAISPGVNQGAEFILSLPIP
jgi:C4-dicarboxylate-specific signal transduction histidine kinase